MIWRVEEKEERTGFICGVDENERMETDEVFVERFEEMQYFPQAEDIWQAMCIFDALFIS